MVSVATTASCKYNIIGHGLGLIGIPCRSTAAFLPFGDSQVKHDIIESGLSWQLAARLQTARAVQSPPHPPHQAQIRPSAMACLTATSSALAGTRLVAPQRGER
jgi:hypothetical protein